MARPRPNPDAPPWWSTDEWITPPELVQQLADEFNQGQPFDLDPAATAENCKALSYFDKTADGLSAPWFGSVWINMPYSNPGVWYKKAVEETQSGRAELIVTLGPPGVDTNWFHDYVIPYANPWRFLRGRIAFLDWQGRPVKGNRQGSLIAVFRRPV